MKNWKQAAMALDLEIPESGLEDISPLLDSVTSALGALALKIPLDIDPATTFSPMPEDAE